MRLSLLLRALGGVSERLTPGDGRLADQHPGGEKAYGGKGETPCRLHDPGIGLSPSCVHSEPNSTAMGIE